MSQKAFHCLGRMSIQGADRGPKLGSENGRAPLDTNLLAKRFCASVCRITVRVVVHTAQALLWVDDRRNAMSRCFEIICIF